MWQLDLYVDRLDAQGLDGVPPSGGATDHRNKTEKRGRWRVRVSIGR